MNQIVVAQFAGRRQPEWPSSLMLPGSSLFTGNEGDTFHGGVVTVEQSRTNVRPLLGPALYDGIPGDGFDHH